MTALLVLLVVSAGPLEAARADYQSGALEAARQKLELLLYPLALEAEEREAHVLLSATYFALGESGRAEEEAIRALAVAAEPLPGNDEYPPDFVAFFAPVAARNEARIAALRAARSRPPPLEPPKVQQPQSPAETVPEAALAPAPAASPSAAWSIVPFGVAQRQLGKPRAVFWAVAHAVLLGTAAASLAGVLSLRGGDGLYAPSDAPAARTLNVLWVAGAWAFGAAWVASIVDALVSEP